MTQQSMGRNVAQLGRIILISSQAVCITPHCHVFSREAEYTYFIVLKRQKINILSIKLDIPGTSYTTK